MTYFGVCNSDGSLVSGTESLDSDNGDVNWYLADSFVCPGSGNQNIQELSAHCYGDATTRVRLGLYTSDGGALVAEGIAYVLMSGSSYAWRGHMSQSDVKAAGGSSPGVLVGGTSYRFAWAQSVANKYVGYQNLGNGLYFNSGTNYTGGMPSTMTGGTNWPGRHYLRCGVDQAATGVSLPMASDYYRRFTQ